MAEFLRREREDAMNGGGLVGGCDVDDCCKEVVPVDN
jgi:hypothetical protein